MLRKCIVHSVETRREQGALLKPKGMKLQASQGHCALKEAKRVHGIMLKDEGVMI